MALPVASDLVKLLAQAGITSIEPALCTAALAEAVERWEQATGFVPFVASVTATAASYDLTDLGRGTKLVNLNAGIPSGTTITATLDGTALTSGYEEDFEAWPLDAPRRKRPYSHLKLSYAATSRLVVTAQWGFCLEADLPEIASQAILAYAALSIAEPDLAKASRGQSATGNIASIDQGTVKIDWATSAAERTRHLSSWQSQWTSAVRIYKRQTL